MKLPSKDEAKRVLNALGVEAPSDIDPRTQRLHEEMWTLLIELYPGIAIPNRDLMEASASVAGLLGYLLGGYLVRRGEVGLKEALEGVMSIIDSNARDVMEVTSKINVHASTTGKAF